MKRIMKNKNISKFVTSLIYIGLGISLIIKPDLVENLFAYLLAAAAIIAGIVHLAVYLFTSVETRIAEDTNGFALGVSLIILGIFVLFKSTMFIILIPFILGFMITFKGVEGIQNILNLRKFGYPVQKSVLIVSLVITAFGLLVMINPFSTMRLLLMMLGAGLLISGLFDIIADIIFTHRLKNDPQPPQTPQAPAEPQPQPLAEPVEFKGEAAEIPFLEVPEE